MPLILALLILNIGGLSSGVVQAQEVQGWLEIVRTESPSAAHDTQSVHRATASGEQAAGVILSDQIAKVLPVNELAQMRLQSTTELAAAVADPVTDYVDMFVGEVRILGRVDVKRIAVGRGTIVKVDVLEEGDLLVIAEAVGSSSIRLWHKDGTQSDFNVRVVAEDPEPRFRTQKMITLRVKMVEFRKSALRELGVDWGDTIEGPTVAAVGDFVGNPLFRPETSDSGLLGVTLPTTVRPFAGYAGLTSTLTSKINLMAASGDALLLAEPVLSCASGESANFLAGGELPYTTTDAAGQKSVAFKDYGIKLDIAPRIDVKGRVQASITTEISSIDPAVAVQGAPGLLTRRAQTSVTVGDRQTIVIAGLLQEQKGADQSQLPGLGRIPVLGGLFRSRQTRNTISELVIFITPEIATAADELSPRRKAQLEKTTTRLRVLERGKLLDLLD